MTSKATKPRVQLTFEPANHGVKVRRGFNEIFLTWKSIRELDVMRVLPRAERFFLERLLDGPVDPAKLCRDARALGFRRARRALGIVTQRKNGVQYWRLPEAFR